MRRREFITLLGGAALWPVAAGAQQATTKRPIIGVLVPGTSSAERHRLAALVQRLGELGWAEGRTLIVVPRWAEGRGERYAEIAAEFVRMNVDVIITGGTPAAVAAMHATSLIPIIFVAVGDPVVTGLVASLARPGANVTGLSNQGPEIAGKRLAFLRDVVPQLRRLAILANSGNASSALEIGDVQVAAHALGLEVKTFEIRRSEDIATAFDTFKDRADALYVPPDPLVTSTHSNRVRVITLALAARLATVYQFRENVEAGGLMSYGASVLDLYRRAGDYVDKILRGTKPGDIPVEQPTKFELVINLTTAKALGLTVPNTLLAIADEVIE
jgi:putative tryptophan/tyrosine transport system substrate-binding protein